MNKIQTIGTNAELIEQVIEQARHIPGTVWQVYPSEVPLDNLPDGLVKLTQAGKTHTFAVQVSTHVNEKNIGHLTYQARQFPNPLLITNHVSSSVAPALQKAGVNYLDRAGNAFIEAEGVFILISGQKRTELLSAKATRAFQPSGLRIIFTLLVNPSLLEANYRTVAEQADVALGSVAYVITDLKELGFLIEIDAERKKLINRKALLNRWLTAYGEKLRPKLVQGSYRFAQQHTNWRTISLTIPDSYWGGEPAADLLTQYLQPERYTLYTREPRTDLMKKYQLLPDVKGNVEVLEAFWHHSLTSTPVPASVPPLLVYADLILSGDPRNQEAAQRLYEKYLADFVE